MVMIESLKIILCLTTGMCCGMNQLSLSEADTDEACCRGDEGGEVPLRLLAV